jgi:diadenosine tetraphosphate (Ap4A) HIT family hydrolase
MSVDPTAPYDDQNVFAKILRGELPCTKVYEDEWTLAFLDIAPLAPVHIHDIPKGPTVSWDDFTAKASDAEITGYIRAIGQIARDENLVVEGYRLLANTGRNSGPEIPHLHVHIFGGRPLGPMLAR